MSEYIPGELPRILAEGVTTTTGYLDLLFPEPEELCDLHEVPMTDGVCSCCLADAEHDGR